MVIGYLQLREGGILGALREAPINSNREDLGRSSDVHRHRRRGSLAEHQLRAYFSPRRQNPYGVDRTHAGAVSTGIDADDIYFGCGDAPCINPVSVVSAPLDIIADRPHHFIPCDGQGGDRLRLVHLPIRGHPHVLGRRNHGDRHGGRRARRDNGTEVNRFVLALGVGQCGDVVLKRCGAFRHRNDPVQLTLEVLGLVGPHSAARRDGRIGSGHGDGVLGVVDRRHHPISGFAVRHVKRQNITDSDVDVRQHIDENAGGRATVSHATPNTAPLAVLVDDANHLTRHRLNAFEADAKRDGVGLVFVG